MIESSEGIDRPTIVLIEDDEAVRESLEGLFRSVGLRTQTFVSVQDYLDRPHTLSAGCMVLDVRLPGKSGLDFHDDLVSQGGHLPVIFISGHADVPMSVRAMKAGAVEFLTKPVRHQDLLDAVQVAIQQDEARRTEARTMSKVLALFEKLTPREREVMALVVEGQRNKLIAEHVGISETTVKLHRGHVMRKMQVKSLVELVRVNDLLVARA